MNAAKASASVDVEYSRVHPGISSHQIQHGPMATKIIYALQDDEFRESLKEVYKRAATDPDFRQLALHDAAAAFKEVGYTTRNWTIEFVEAKEGVDDVLQLPPAIEVTPDLTEEELEAVAGGILKNDGCCIIISCSNVSCVVDSSDTSF